MEGMHGPLSMYAHIVQYVRQKGKMQASTHLFRLPGGTERVINTKSTTVVENIISELCTVIGVEDPNESEEFSLYCIVEGETFTVPLAKEHYILDVTTGEKTKAFFYLFWSYGA